MTRNDDFIQKRLGAADAVWNGLGFDKDAIIEASAGTGKTYTLESIVLKLVSDTARPVQVKNILLVTFTEKAAGELKDRIRAILSEAGVLPPDFDETAICTIHSFCREILSEYAFENRVPMQLEIGSSDADIVHRAVRAALLGDDFRSECADAFAGYMHLASLESAEDLVEAAEEKLARSAASDSPPPAPVRLDAGSIDKMKRLASKVDFTFPGVLVNARSAKSFEDACNSTREALARLDPGDIASSAEALAACAANCGKLNPSVNGRGPGARVFDVVPALKDFVETVCMVHALCREYVVSELAFLAWPLFRRLKDEAAVFTFDDLVTRACRVIEQESAREKQGGRSAFMDSIRRRYRIALVDEFQDTDARQWTIFGSLFSSEFNRLEGAPAPEQGFLLVVGDPKQAIYSFRGADIAAYMAAKKTITAGGDGSSRSLDTVFRSSKPLVDAFNRMFGEESGWFDGMEENGTGIECPEVRYPEGNARFLEFEDLTGCGAVNLLESLPGPPPQNLARNAGCGNTSACISVFMQNAAREMKRLRSLGVACRTASGVAGERVDHVFSYSDMCVLVRNSTEAGLVKRELGKALVPYSHYKERGICAGAEAEALVALFDYLSSPDGHGRLAALLLTPVFGVHPSALEESLASGGGGAQTVLNKWHALSSRHSWAELFESVMDDTSLARPEPGDDGFDRRWMAFRQLLDMLFAEAGRTASGPGDFAALLRRWRKDDRRSGDDGTLRRRENDGDRVQIMTMHVSKGLEFKAVFVAAGFGAYEKDDPSELRRLFYVALTRAECKLYLPWTKWDSHMRNGKVERGVGSVASPLLGNGFLARAILAYFGDSAAASVVSFSRMEETGAETGEARTGEAGTAELPEVYDIGDLRDIRFRWDSFTSLNSRGETGKVMPAVLKENDESVAGSVSSDESRLLPRGNISGLVFHEIMDTLCGNDESEGETGFAVGNESLDKALDPEGPLVATVLRAMRNHAMADAEEAGDSVSRTLVRMVWRALNTRIEIGDRSFCLKDVCFADRLAEVEFAVDEASVFGAALSSISGKSREGVLNGSVDLLARPWGAGGPVYIIDWKTNSLPGYGKADTAAAMEENGYPLQFKLYSLAVARWLSLAPLAGIAYLFVRGADEGGGCGVYSRRMDGKLFDDCIRSVFEALAQKRENPAWT